jgi:hypothetical protein
MTPDEGSQEKRMKPVDVRGRLVDVLRLDLIGPAPGLSNPSEVLGQAPSRWYLTGFLVPRDAGEEQKAEEESTEEGRGVRGQRRGRRCAGAGIGEEEVPAVVHRPKRPRARGNGHSQTPGALGRLDLNRLEFRIRVRAQRYIPDMFYVNEFADRLRQHNSEIFEHLFA